MSAREQIEAMLAARTQAMARFDVDAVMEFYVEESELILNDMPTFSGREAVRGFFASMLAEGTFEPAFAIEDCRVAGSLAVIYARELLTLESRREPRIDQYAMRHMAMLTCEGGRWLIVRSMVSLEGPGSVEVLS